MGLLLVMPLTDVKLDTRKKQKGGAQKLEDISQKHKIPPKNQNTRQTNYKALMLTTYQIRPSN